VHTEAAALRAARAAAGGAGRDAEVMVIGGASVYAAFMPRATRLYVTLVHARIDGDTWFPDYEPEAWRESERSEQPADARNPHACSFLVLERRAGPQATGKAET